uniref:Uncharacterized protein n=1 Tax=Anguilla anguilla TaxID=7936 RepID=A0A0E9VSU4_ANGAN
MLIENVVSTNFKELFSILALSPFLKNHKDQNRSAIMTLCCLVFSII